MSLASRFRRWLRMRLGPAIVLRFPSPVGKGIECANCGAVTDWDRHLHRKNHVHAFLCIAQCRCGIVFVGLLGPSAEEGFATIPVPEPIRIATPTGPAFPSPGGAA